MVAVVAVVVGWGVAVRRPVVERAPLPLRVPPLAPHGVVMWWVVVAVERGPIRPERGSRLFEGGEPTFNNNMFDV